MMMAMMMMRMIMMTTKVTIVSCSDVREISKQENFVREN